MGTAGAIRVLNLEYPDLIPPAYLRPAAVDPPPGPPGEADTTLAARDLSRRPAISPGAHPHRIIARCPAPRAGSNIAQSSGYVSCPSVGARNVVFPHAAPRRPDASR